MNEFYSKIEKNDDKDDYPFSILKSGVTIWKCKVFQTHNRTLLKAAKLLSKELFKLIKKQIMINKAN